MIADLPKWYTIAAISPITGETLEKRSLAIESIIGQEKFPFYSNCIKLYLSIPIKKHLEFNKEFCVHFKATDVLFLEEGGQIEKRILAGAIINEVIKKQSADSVKIAMALEIAIFSLPTEVIINFDIVQNAISFLHDEAIKVREIDFDKVLAPKIPAIPNEAQTVESLSAHIKGLAGTIKSLLSFIEKKDLAISERIAIVEEEANIHWWLFRSFSETKNTSIAELDPEVAIFIIPLELSQLYQKIPAPVNSQAFLSKIYNNVNNACIEISIKQSIDIIFKNDLIPSFGNTDNESINICPLYFAYSKAVESGGKDVWTTLYETQTIHKTDFKCDPIDVSLQFLRETLFLKL